LATFYLNILLPGYSMPVCALARNRKPVLVFVDCFHCVKTVKTRLIIEFKMSNVLDRIPLKHCFSNVNARRRGFSRGAALRRELAAVSAPLEAASYRFSCRSKRTAPGGTQPMGGQGYRSNQQAIAKNWSLRHPLLPWRPASEPSEKHPQRSAFPRLWLRTGESQEVSPRRF